MQVPTADSARDPTITDPERNGLPASDDAVLHTGEFTEHLMPLKLRPSSQKTGVLHRVRRKNYRGHHLLRGPSPTKFAPLNAKKLRTWAVLDAGSGTRCGPRWRWVDVSGDGVGVGRIGRAEQYAVRWVDVWRAG